MNAIRTLYRNAGLITEDDYVKVNDNLWVKSGSYQKQTWHKADKSTLPTKEELNEIQLKIQELIQIQETCGLDSLQQILEDKYPWVWSSTEYDTDYARRQRMSDGIQHLSGKNIDSWVIPVRRSL